MYKWSYEALCLNEYTGLTLTCDPSELIVVAPNVTVCPITTGEQEIKNLALTSAELWIPLVVLAAMVIFFRLASVMFLVMQMRRLKKKNQ